MLLLANNVPAVTSESLNNFTVVDKLLIQSDWQHWLILVSVELLTQSAVWAKGVVVIDCDLQGTAGLGRELMEGVGLLPLACAGSCAFNCLQKCESTVSTDLQGGCQHDQAESLVLGNRVLKCAIGNVELLRSTAIVASSSVTFLAGSRACMPTLEPQLR